MSGPGFTRSDLCLIRAAIVQAEPARVVRGLLSADGYPMADDAPLGGECLVASRRGERTEAER
jgi:hypothetical protein